MKDQKYISFLQWALPRLNMRWRGFKKVRGQVCKRIGSRLSELNLKSLVSYIGYLENNPQEWAILDQMCRITISRFYRNRVIFDYFFSDLLPIVIEECIKKKNKTIRIWSAGCASGEEPYTIAIGWHFTVLPLYPDLQIEIVATDIDPVVLQRGRVACYPQSSLRSLPEQWRKQAFEQTQNGYLLNPPFKESVRFEQLDIRENVPKGSFQIILCRNLAFTYFNPALQQQVVQHMEKALASGGFLITGTHENAPTVDTCLLQWIEHMPIYLKNDNMQPL